MAGWDWTSVFTILQGNKSSDFHGEVWHWLWVFLQMPVVRLRNFPSFPSLLSVVIMKRSWVCQRLLSVCVETVMCFFFLFDQFDISLYWSSDLNDLCSWDKSHLVLMYNSCMLLDSVCGGLFRVSVQFSCSVVSDSLRPHGLQHTSSQSLLKLTAIESVMPSNHLILCRPLLLLPSILPSIRVFSNESALCIR